MILCSKLKNGLFKIVTKSQIVTKFTVTKSRLHCRYLKKHVVVKKVYISTLIQGITRFLVKIRKNNPLVKRTPKSLESTKRNYFHPIFIIKTFTGDKI